MTPLARRRLSNLFVCSGTILISSLLGISLLHVESLERSVLWIAMSLLLLTLGTSWLLLDRQRVSHLDAHERSDVKAYVHYPFAAGTVLVLALQIGNVITLQTSWPVFVALTDFTVFAFQQFILMIRMNTGEAAPE